MKKKLILGLLASTLTLACVAGCTDNGGNSSSGDATNGLDDAKAYLTLLYNKPDLVEGRADYDVVNTVSIEGVTYTVTWTVDVESGVVIEAGEDKTVVNVDETSDTEVAYVLTATITDADGNTTTVTFNRTLLAAPSIVPSPITAAPEEETAYKLYMYQVTNKGDAYFTGKMSGFYYQSSSTLADAVDVYAKAVDGGYNLYFTDADGVTQYLGIENEYSDSQGKFYNNVIFSESTEIAEGKIATYTFTWSDEYGTMITKLNAKSGTDKETTETAEVTLYLGTYDTFWTFSASDIKKITNDDTCIAYLVEMVDKSAISAEDKVAAEKAAIDVQTIHNGDATVELPVKGATYGDVTISWAIKSGENVALDGNTLTITAPSASTTAVITATLTCGEVSDTLDVELTLNPTPAAAVIPEAGVAYKMYLNQVTNGTVLYLDGGVSGRYLTMTEKGSEAIDVYAEVVEGGYKFYTNVDSAKKYINIYNNDAGKASVNYADATENVYNYDEEKNCWYTALGSDEVYLGTYNNFATVSASYTSFIDADNTGISQFPALFIKATDVPADNVPDQGGETTTVTTIADALTAAEGSTATFSGTVSEIYQTWNETYSNMSFYVTDGTNTILVFRAGTKVVVGDEVSVSGTIAVYNSTNQIAEGATVTVTAAHTCSTYTEATCTKVATCVVCGTAKDDVLANHTYVDGTCSVCGAAENTENLETQTVNVSISDYADANSWVNSTQYTELKMNDDITVTVSGTPVGNYGVNTGKYYTNGENWRIYQNESPAITFTAAEGKTIVSVKITYAIKNTGILTNGETQIESDTVVNVNASTITFSVGNTGTATNGQVQITAIEVIYA